MVGAPAPRKNSKILECQRDAYELAKIRTYIGASNGKLLQSLIKIMNHHKDIQHNGKACGGEDARTYWSETDLFKRSKIPKPNGECEANETCQENGICSKNSNTGWKYFPVSSDVSGVCTFAQLDEPYTEWKRCAQGTKEGPRGAKPGPKYVEGPNGICIEDNDEDSDY
jgi:hypothetical protein